MLLFAPIVTCAHDKNTYLMIEREKKAEEDKENGKK